MGDDVDGFFPLDAVVLPGLGALNLSGLILVVGPNSSGKSQLLQDIYQRICGDRRRLVVAEQVRVRRPPNFEYCETFLLKEGYVERTVDDNGNPHLRPKKNYAGSGQNLSIVPSGNLQSWFGQHPRDDGAAETKRSEFLNFFGRFLVTGLFLNRRLVALDQTGSVDLLTSPPNHDLHALMLDDRAQEALGAEMARSFGKFVWPDQTRGQTTCLRVSDAVKRPSDKDRLSPTKMNEYRQIESEGDGMKSYAATCVSLLLGRRPVCLVDEPEMCLHPPQAYNLGQFIGRRAQSDGTVTFVSTHSSQVLRGVIQTRKDLQVVRLTRDDDRFDAHLVPAELLKDALAKPTVRAESVLDGIFAQGVVIVEGEGDRLVYQTVWETLAEELKSDVHMATVGGIGGIADTCKLYRKLRIPVAVVADIDFITDNERVRCVLDVMAPENEATRLTALCEATMGQIRLLPPAPNPADIRKEVCALGEEDAAWADGTDVETRRRISKLASKLDRLQRLKRGGVESYDAPINTMLQTVVSDLVKHGIFLVPVGELEWWLRKHGIEESRETKWAWANAAATRIQGLGAQSGDVWDFIRSVGAFLRADAVQPDDR